MVGEKEMVLIYIVFFFFVTVNFYFAMHLIHLT